MTRPGIAAVVVLAVSPLRAELSGRDRRHLEGIYRDTWACLAHFVSEAAGLPFDLARRPPGTSITNIGLYLAAAAAAARTGLVTEAEARARLGRALDSPEKIERWGYGFPVTWLNAETLVGTENQFSAVEHLSNLAGGLIAVKGLFPEFADRIDSHRRNGR